MKQQPSSGQDATFPEPLPVLPFEYYGLKLPLSAGYKDDVLQANIGRKLSDGCRENAGAVASFGGVGATSRK